MEALLKLPQHTVKVIITTRIWPQSLALLEAGRQKLIRLDEGLGAQHSEGLVRALDPENEATMATATPEQLVEAYEVTRGNPRALELLAAAMAYDRSADLGEELRKLSIQPENYVNEALVGDAYRRLDPTAQRVMQALASFGQPVPAEAVDKLLAPQAIKARSKDVLERLVRFVLAERNEAGYFLHSRDRQYILKSFKADAIQTSTELDLLRRTDTSIPAATIRSLTVQLEAAVNPFDRARTVELCETLIGWLRSSDGPFPEPSARRVLATLRRRRQFPLMVRVADALIASGTDGTTIRRQYAQGLLDQGLTAAGLDVLDAAIAAADPIEQAEVQALVGRAHRDRYLATDAAATSRRRLHLEQAIHAYYDTFIEDPSRLWHGINAVALLDRATRDGVALAAFPHPSETAQRLAEQVLVAVEAKGDQQTVWDRATAVEANLALGRFGEALEWLDTYLADPSIDEFEYESMLRQLAEVWGLAANTGPGSTLLPLLQAKLLQREGGEVLVGPSEVDKPEPQPSPEGDAFRRVFGTQRFTTTRWFENALDRCRGVARIQDEVGDGVGTGFLVVGTDLHPGLPPVVLITNAHVIPKAIQPDEAFLAFRGLEDFTEPGVRVRRVLWSSPPNELDATIVEPEQLPAGVLSCPLARNLPPLDADPRERVHVIGHPLGRPDLQLSILDNHLLDYDDTVVHYRSPTEPGSSGSPVMDKRWAVIALHHSGDNEMPRLHGTGVYEANEGIRIDQIQKALLRDL